MNDEFTRQAVVLKLRKMFEGTHFSICTVRDAITALKITVNKGQLESLALLHCVDFADMEPQMREQCFLRTMALFAEATSFNLSLIDATFGGGALAIDPEKRKAIGLLPWSRLA